MFYQVKAARKDKNTGKIHHEVVGKPDIIYLSIRAGLVWPFQTQPGYWLILGQRDEENAFRKYPLVLLDEGESKDLGKLFDLLTDAAVRLMCEDVYADMSEENYCYRDAFCRYRDNGNIRRLYLNSASYVENFEFGIGLIHEWLKDEALRIDRDSIIAQQLGRIPESVLEENQLAEYFAINALRFVLAAFVKTPWREPMKDIDYGDPCNYAGYFRDIPI